MKKASIIFFVITIVGVSSFGQTQSGCTVTFPNNFDSPVNISDIYDASLCASGNLVLSNVNSDGLGTITFDESITLNSLTVDYKNGNSPAEIIVPTGVILTVTTFVDLNLSSAVQDKFLEVSGTLDVGGNLDLGGIDLEIDGNGGTINAGSITGADLATCGADTDCPTFNVPGNCEPAGALCNEPALPINLAHFGVKSLENKIELTWQTASEENNDYFTIERSSNGLDYHELARVAGAGNSFEILNYSIKDTNPFQGVSYYRLKQTDYDGTNETFKVVAAEFYGNTTAIKVMQTLGSGNELLIHNNLDEENIAYIYDMTGRGGMIGSLKVGENYVDLSQLNALSGMYTLRVVNVLGKTLVTQKFVIQ